MGAHPRRAGMIRIDASGSGVLAGLPTEQLSQRMRLIRRFDERVIDTPISEAGFSGFAIGAAMAGMRPIVQFRVASLIYVAFDQLVNQAAKLRLMLGGQVDLPITYTIMASGARGGQAGQHADNPYPYLLHAGFKVVAPSCAHDAKGLLAAAIREDDPVVFIASTGLQGRKAAVPRHPVPCRWASGAPCARAAT